MDEEDLYQQDEWGGILPAHNRALEIEGRGGYGLLLFMFAPRFIMPNMYMCSAYRTVLKGFLLFILHLHTEMMDKDSELGYELLRMSILLEQELCNNKIRCSSSHI